MTLDKDKQNIYTIDSENYIIYMHEQEQEQQQNSLLTTIIKFLLLTLLLIVSYFLYQVAKSDQSFSEVFNKKELSASYKKFKNRVALDNNSPKYVEQTAVLSITKEYIEPLILHKNAKEQKKEKAQKRVLSKEYIELIAKELK